MIALCILIFIYFIFNITSIIKVFMLSIEKKKLLHELPIVLRLKILGNNKILGKSQIWVETYPCAHSPFKKLNFSNSSPKSHKNRYQTFLDLFSFTGFLYLVPNFLSSIIDTIFQLTPTIFIFFDQICPKRVSPDKNGKFELARASMVVIF